ncbi:MAG: ACT domain-containing protein, partial [Bacteroidota bacterium]
MNRKLQLYLMNDTFTVNKLAQFAEIPSILMKGEMVFSMRTDEELCIICPEFMAPNNVQQELGWRCIKIEGEFTLDDVGVMVSVLQPLAEANISILATSTFNTDYVFVRDEQLVHA